MIHEIHTSDRTLFRRCRRKWDWASHYRQNLTPKGPPDPNLYFGSGIHFALEDFHGWQRWDDPIDAYKAYDSAHLSHERPDEWQDLQVLAAGMLDYYAEYWLPQRNIYKTLWIDGVPQVEVDFAITIHEFENGDSIVYAGTLDRIVVDPSDYYYIEDYKTAARFDTSKLETDPQVNSYTWIGGLIYGDKVDGFLYTQLRKSPPTFPLTLQNGDFSMDKRQNTSFSMYKRALVDRYGRSIPMKYKDHLNWLASRETSEGDDFVRRDKIRRNKHFREAEFIKALGESLEMIDPNLVIYPNPTRDCSWDCPFRDPCIAKDDGADYKAMLRSMFKPRTERGRDPWRLRIPELQQQPNKRPQLLTL